VIVTDVLDLLPTLGPIFLLILLGQWFFRRGFPDPDFWLQAERLTYFVLFPSLLIQRLASANLAPYRDYAAVILLTMTAASALLFPLARGLGVGPRGFAAVYQGAIRFNTYIALALASALYGPSGVALMALIIAIEMPLVNVLAVWVLSRGQGILGAGSLVKMLLSNPLIVAALIGLGLNLGGPGRDQPAREPRQYPGYPGPCGAAPGATHGGGGAATGSDPPLRRDHAGGGGQARGAAAAGLRTGPVARYGRA